MSNKRILIITEYFFPEEFLINDLAIDWKKKGYDVEVLTQNPTYPFGKVFDGFNNRLYRKDTYNDIIIHRVKAVTGYRDSIIKKVLKYFVFMIYGSIFSLVNGKKYDFIFGHSMAALTAMLPAVLIKKVFKKKLTLWVQDIWPDSVYAYGFKESKILKMILDKYVAFIYANTDNFAISCPGFKNNILRYTSNPNIEFMPNWSSEINIDSKAFKFSEKNKIHFTFAGNIGKMQNLQNIIIAFNLLPEKYHNECQLNIIGDGSNLDNLKQLVIEKKYHNVFFYGKKRRDEMSIYLNGSDYLIVSLIDKPIFTITIPSKVQTYIAAKKPIFAIINGDTASLIEDYNLGYCADPSNINDIKNGFIKFIELHEDERKKLISNSEKLNETIFNKKLIMDSLEKMLVDR